MDRLLCLKASAGSGKTFSLASRYIALLYLGAHPSEILAVTFTNKAANEMRRRILDKLGSLGEDPEFLESLKRETALEEGELLERAPHLLSLFLTSDIYITTIDSFLQRIARKFGYYQGVDLDFGVIERWDGELIWRRFLKRLPPSLFGKLLQFSNYLRKSPREELELLYQREKELPPLQELVEEDPLPRYRELQREVKELLNGCSQRTLGFVDRPPEKLLALDPIRNVQKEGGLIFERSPFKKCASPELERTLLQLIETAQKVLIYRERSLVALLTRLYREYYRPTLSLLERSENTLDFKGIEHLVYDLLSTSIHRDFLYFRLDSRIGHILIDEFQDTSITQWEIFAPLVEEIASGPGFRSFFYVGDTKQAIYRFRGGESQLFDEVYHQFLSFGMVQKSLRTNYRSRPVIVEFVNRVFQLQERSHLEKGGYVEVMVNPPEKGGRRFHYKENLERALKRLLEVGVDPIKIAVLTSTNEMVREIGEFIEERFGLEAVTTSRKRVIHQPKARAVIDLMKWFYYREKGRLYLANFQSFLGLPFHEEIEIPKGPPAKMVKAILDRFNLWDEGTLRLLEHSLTYRDLVEFVHRIDEYGEELPIEDFRGINVMTIHKAKGLEFDHLVVVDTPRRERGDKVLFDYDGVRLRDIRVKMKSLEWADPSFAALLEREKKLMKEDLEHREYVAYTRAKESLFILKNREKSSLVALEASGVGEGVWGRLEPQEGGNPSPRGEVERFTKHLRYFDPQDYRGEREYEPDDYEAIYLGSALHLLFEMEGNDHALNRYGIYTDMEKARRLYGRGMESEAYRELLERGRLHRELPFIFRGQHGVIDLLIEGEEELIVIDYKSVKPHDEEKYLKQVGFYKEAVEAIYGKPVRGFLFYLDRCELREV
ncbi:MAG: RecB-like helicase [Epsilonproteobacteria bacterium]|nr:helicase [Campylobacterota bacterium]NPA57439.1 RecB-like helicase [Campylobacterota bacterium]